MHLLFIQGGSRLKKDNNGKWYTDPNFNDSIWSRYQAICDHLTIMLRQETMVYNEEFAKSHFNEIPNSEKISIVPLVDITSPKKNFASIFKRFSIKKKIAQQIANADKVIIRSNSYYTQIAYKYCLKYNKEYLFEVTGFSKESFSMHSFLGKLIANSYEKKCKQMARDAAFALYVTNEALQKRYPSNGKMMGCSDVQLKKSSQDILSKKLKDLTTKKSTFVLGTAAFLDVKWKGQEIVLKAISILQQRGFTGLEYQMVGLGTGSELIKKAEFLGIKDSVKILGALPHKDIFHWLDTIDIYIQPSYQEGLCRSIVEAMSRACPIICSNTGGNYELISKDFIFPCGDAESLANLIEKIIFQLPQQAQINFEKSSFYDAEYLDQVRKNFMLNFIRN